MSAAPNLAFICIFFNCQVIRVQRNALSSVIKVQGKSNLLFCTCHKMALFYNENSPNISRMARVGIEIHIKLYFINDPI